MTLTLQAVEEGVDCFVPSLVEFLNAFPMPLPTTNYQQPTPPLPALIAFRMKLTCEGYGDFLPLPLHTGHQVVV